ncbi:hypothetical protein HBI56_102660 [Parastagonospora nodorum]|uniref:Uncharacterized protein n=1 Tax=Phaeosphaeria nodorum (strain SN15 / ATCC MYA-4574 / FGSC 10173) TaxID=321614 RepID=A0A7U2FC15_PHANO|nr:hypothetical protein HBH56_136200 [Parastagonospora nodorum]QRD02520.1 hypothetical protein JI435_418170 [Parastagonospora nodorum SN15]KAH3927099.1 hypothetical protein HBH54_157090 [Parastagonospora nodorum]KAH3949333.1 hypothetical protein HBH53_091360 [Parastagonospora nodorum]KAH3956498.1 hypothetical protein HBH51_240810 [Parastagonospora nodorum]
MERGMSHSISWYCCSRGERREIVSAEAAVPTQFTLIIIPHHFIHPQSHLFALPPSLVTLLQCSDELLSLKLLPTADAQHHLYPLGNLKHQATPGK